MASENFGWDDYLVFGAILASSLSVGVYFGISGRGNQTNEDFLLAGRNMGIFPVTLSLICTFVSAIIMLGTPLEVYNYGIQHMTLLLGFIPNSLMLALIYVPVYYNLKLNSAYQYFELRFGKKVRKMISVCAIIHLILYMPLSVYGPSIALDAVSGLNKYISSAAIFIVCIIYSSIGGLRGVLWSDTLQAFIMLGSVITVIIFGLIEMGERGGLVHIWDMAKLTGRDTFFEFDFDPRRRFSIWTGLIGVYFNWTIILGATQAQIQRYNSVGTLRKAQICIFLNAIGMMLFFSLLAFLGLIIFGFYFGCDPIGSKRIEEPDQLFPIFVNDVMGKIKGLKGFFVAGITAGSLSSVSSALNAFPAIIIEDFVKPYRPNMNEKTLLLTSKAISVISGLIAFSLVFLIESMGDIVPFATNLFGNFLGPILALFTLGLFFPFANSLGSALGMIVGLILNTWLSIGTILGRNQGILPNQKRFLTTDGCPDNKLSGFVHDNYYLNGNFTSPYDNWKELSENDSALTKLYSISYMWQPTLNVTSIVFLGGLFSIIVNLFRGNGKRVLVKKRYLSGPILALWDRILSREFMEKWVDYSEINIENK